MTCPSCPTNPAECCTTCKRMGLSLEMRDGALISRPEIVVMTRDEFAMVKSITLAKSGKVPKGKRS